MRQIVPIHQNRAYWNVIGIWLAELDGYKKQAT
jgi:hypothetical protein